MSEDASMEQITNLNEINNSAIRDNEQNDSILIDTTRQLLSQDEFKQFECLLESLDFNTVRRLVQNEEFLEMFLKFKLYQGCWLEVLEVLKTGNNFTKSSFLTLWDEANYQKYQSENTGVLTPIIKYRLRQGNPPPESICPSGRRPTRCLPTKSVNVLQKWFNAHKNYPYPCKSIKTKLAKMAGINMKKVTTWFQNARRKHIKDIKKQRLSESNQFPPSSNHVLDQPTDRSTSTYHEGQKINDPDLKSSSQIFKGDNLPLLGVTEKPQEEENDITETLKDNETYWNNMYVYLNPFNEDDDVAIVTENRAEHHTNNVHLFQGHGNNFQGHNNVLHPNGSPYIQMKSPASMSYPSHQNQTQIQTYGYPSLLPSSISRQDVIDQSEKDVNIPVTSEEMVKSVTPINFSPIHCTRNPETCDQCLENCRKSYNSLPLRPHNQRYMPYWKLNTQDNAAQQEILNNWERSWKIAKNSATTQTQAVDGRSADANWGINENTSAGHEWKNIDRIPKYTLPYKYLYPAFYIPTEYKGPSNANLNPGIHSLQCGVYMDAHQRNVTSQSDTMQTVDKVIDFSSSQRKDRITCTVPKKVRHQMRKENVLISENMKSRLYAHFGKDKSPRPYLVCDKCHTRVINPAVKSLHALQKLCDNIESTVQSPIDYVAEVCHELGEELCYKQIQNTRCVITAYCNGELQSQDLNLLNTPIDMTLNEASNISDSDEATRLKQNDHDRSLDSNMLSSSSPEPDEECYSDTQECLDLPMKIQHYNYQPMEMNRTEIRSPSLEDTYPGVVIAAVQGLLNMSSSQESE
ncbi:Iroquois-class homeodomain protein IRX-5 [Mactra antiquata]